MSSNSLRTASSTCARVTAGPGGPTGPAGPAFPVGPAGPVLPMGPARPVFPREPCSPFCPPGRFVLLANRFDWAKASGAKGSKTELERRRTALRFERVKSAKLHGFDLNDKRNVLALLAITFTPSGDDQSPDGDVTLTFSGGAAIRLGVECIEVELKDLGAAWAAKQSPDHSEGTS